jgi:hypothetical protein
MRQLCGICTYYSKIMTLDTKEISEEILELSSGMKTSSCCNAKVFSICFSSGSISWRISHIHTSHLRACSRNSPHYHSLPLLSAFEDLVLFLDCVPVQLPATDARLCTCAASCPDASTHTDLTLHRKGVETRIRNYRCYFLNNLFIIICLHEPADSSSWSREGRNWNSSTHIT